MEIIRKRGNLNKRNASAINNDHTPELMQITNRRGREFMKLNVVIDYNAKDSQIVKKGRGSHTDFRDPS